MPLNNAQLLVSSEIQITLQNLSLSKTLDQKFRSPLYAMEGEKTIKKVSKGLGIWVTHSTFVLRTG